MSMRKGYKHTAEAKFKISMAQKGRVRTLEHCKKLSESSKKSGFQKGHIPWNKGESSGMLGRKHTKETKIIMSKVVSEETKEKLRESVFNYAKRVNGAICPRIGRNETQLLNELEIELNHKILRQYKTCGYFLDGYIPKLKLAIEIDEMPKITERDVKREQNITDRLGCQFLRIKDYV